MEVKTNLKLSDFQVLDVIVTTEGKTYTVGFQTKGIFLSRDDAFNLYKEGKVLQKSFEVNGESIFYEVR